MSSQTTPPTPPRLYVISPAMIEHVMEHPARGNRWSVRELAASIGCSHATLGYLRSGARTTISARLATKFAEAVGCETAVLFAAEPSKESDTTTPLDGEVVA